MFARQTLVALGSLITLTLVMACGARTSNLSPDLSTSPRFDHGVNPVVDRGVVPRLDRGVGPRLDRGIKPPPDVSVPRDFPRFDQGGPCSTKIGTPCTSSASCCGGLQCIALYTGAQVCSTPCTPDDPQTPLVNEDSCKLPAYACGAVDPFGSQYACLLRCQPALGKNPCAPGIACHPSTNQLAFTLQSAFCAYPACKGGEDCPVRLGTPCNVGAPNACAGLPPTAFCAPDEPGSFAGHCALPGACDQLSGLCAPHGSGTASAKVGDPCKDDRDCGKQMFCIQQEMDASGRVANRNGYCSIDGCAFSNTLKERSCPPQATCQLIFPGGRCFKTCDQQDATGCRGLAADKFGDYECYGWNNLSIVGGQIASDATCEPAVYTCDFFGNNFLDCSVLGLQQNPSNMRCRDPQSGTDLPQFSPNGVCLDDTASGS